MLQHKLYRWRRIVETMGVIAETFFDDQFHAATRASRNPRSFRITASMFFGKKGDDFVSVAAKGGGAALFLGRAVRGYRWGSFRVSEAAFVFGGEVVIGQQFFPVPFATGAFPFSTGPAFEIENGVIADDARDLFRMSGSPVVDSA